MGVWAGAATFGAVVGFDVMTREDRRHPPLLSRSWPGAVERTCDGLLDAVVVALATWTVVYHICLVLRLGVAWATGLEALALVGSAVLWTIHARRAREPAPAPVAQPAGAARRRRPSPLVLLTVLAAGVAAVAMAASLPWPLVWVCWLVAAAAGTCWAAVRLTERPGARSAARGGDAAGAVVALAWALALTTLSMFTLRPNPDDLYYVNLSQWVAEHGTFPLRDTIFSDLGFPMSNWPPIASFDGLVGTLAHLTGTLAASVDYVAVPPVATCLSVLALWRLLRAWRVRYVAVALCAALLFLLLDGTSSYGPPGNLFLTRIWQGKVILLCLMVPLLLVYALRYVERPTRAGALRLFLGGTAAVALSTTAIFLTPLVAAAGAAPLLRRSRGWTLTGLVAMAAYPLAAGATTLALGGRSADDFGIRKLYRFDAEWIGHEIFLTGLLALVAVFAVLVGALLVPHPAARVTTGLLAGFTGLVLIPGLTHLTYGATGLGPTLWRVSWGCSIAALVGVAVARAGERLPHRRWTAPVATAVATTLVVVFGAPIWAPDTNARLEVPFHWQRSNASRSVTNWILASSRPGDVVLAPDSLAITVAVTTTDVKTVAPRDYFMDYLRDDPAFHFPERIALVHFANNVGPWRRAVVTHALEVLDVHIVCLPVEDFRRAHAVRLAGYTPALKTDSYRCLRT